MFLLLFILQILSTFSQGLYTVSVVSITPYPLVSYINNTSLYQQVNMETNEPHHSHIISYSITAYLQKVCNGSILALGKSERGGTVLLLREY